MEVVKAIVLKSIPFTENQRILKTFSAERGYMSFITPEVFFRSKNNNAIQCMQITEIEFIPNHRNGLHKIKTIHPIKNTASIYFDVYKMNIALLWGEILNLSLQHEEKNEDLFDFIAHAIEYLNDAGKEIANFNLFFLYRFCGLMGFRIDTSSYRPEYVFNISDGGFYPPEEYPHYASGPHSARAIHHFCSCQPEDIQNITLNRESRSILLDILLLFLEFHLNLNFNIKSINVIRDIFR